MPEPKDNHDGEGWSLRAVIKAGATIEGAAAFLCRSIKGSVVFLLLNRAAGHEFKKMWDDTKESAEDSQDNGR